MSSRPLGAILSLWTTPSTPLQCGAVDPCPRLRFRRAHPRHGGTDLPLLVGGIRGPWGGVAVRALGENRGLLEPGFPPAAPSRGSAGPPARPGGDRSPSGSAGRAGAGAAAPAGPGRACRRGARRAPEGWGRLGLLEGLGERPSRAARPAPPLRLHPL